MSVMCLDTSVLANISVSKNVATPTLICCHIWTGIYGYWTCQLADCQLTD